MRYRLLGPFEVLDGDEPVHLGGGRQRAFLALLLLNANQVVSVDRIIDLLWGDEAPDTVANVIQVYVSRLRKALEPDRPKGADSSVLLTRRPGYMLKVDPEQIDARRFEELTQRGRAAMAEGAMGIAASLFRQALDLWSGEPLADLAFEDFARTEIERLVESRLVALENLHDAQLAMGHHEDIVGTLETLVADHPLREQLWAQLMLALYRSGRQAEALRAYRRAADILIEELGIDPGPALQQLEESILLQDPSLDAPAVEREPLPVQPDHAPAPLIGRRDELAAARDAFSVIEGGRPVLITVTGEPGTGVGRLLAEIDRTARASGLNVRRARAFPGTDTQAGEILRQLGGLEAEEPQVVVVDRAHHCDPTSLAAIRRELMAGRPTLAVLGAAPRTGRAGLAIDQLASAVAGVGTVLPMRLGRLTFTDCAQVMDESLATKLIELTGGFPFDVAEVLSALREANVVSWSDARIEVNGDLEVAVSPSPSQRVKDLPKPRRRLVEACALAEQPMPLAVVSRLLSTDEDEALETIEDLAADGFLVESPAGVETADFLSSGRLVDHIGDTRRAALYRDLASAFDGHAPRRTLGWFALQGRDDDRAADLLGLVGGEEVERGNYGEAQRLLEGAISAMERLGQTAGERWGMAHLGLAQCHRFAGWSELAAGALDVAVPNLSGAALVDALGWAAQVADDRRRVAESEWWVARAERAAVLDGAPEKLGSLLSLRARVLNRLAFAEESDICAAKADELLSEHGGPRQRYLSTYNRAWVAFDRGEMRVAEALFATLADLATGEAAIADLAAWRGRALFHLAKVHEARAELDRAIDLGRRTGDAGPVFLGLVGRAEGALAFDMQDEAEGAVAELMGLVLHQFPAWENLARHFSARLALLDGDRQRASDEIDNALELAGQGLGGRRWWLASRLVQLQLGGVAGPEVDLLVEEAAAARWHVVELPMRGWAAAVRGDAQMAAAVAAEAQSFGLLPTAIRAMAAAGEAIDERVAASLSAALAGVGSPWEDRLRALVGQPNR